MSKAEIGVADETVMLEGSPIQVVPSLEMAMHFSRGPGGIRGAVARCGNLDFDTIVTVVAMGSGLSRNPKRRERLEKAVYDAGLNNVAVHCIRILESLAFGGRNPDVSVPEEEEQEGPDNGPLVPASE